MLTTGNATGNAVDLVENVAAYGTKTGMHDAADPWVGGKRNILAKPRFPEI